jgi:hypothetical protein
MEEEGEGVQTPSYCNVVATTLEGGGVKRPPFDLSPHLKTLTLFDNTSNGKIMDIYPKSILIQLRWVIFKILDGAL